MQGPKAGPATQLWPSGFSGMYSGSNSRELSPLCRSESSIPEAGRDPFSPPESVGHGLIDDPDEIDSSAASSQLAATHSPLGSDSFTGSSPATARPDAKS